MTLKNMFSVFCFPFRATQITLLTIAIGVFPIGIATAQSGTASIRGLVLDPQSRIVVGARITIADDSNRLVRSQAAGALGEFSFVGLPPATYRLDAEAPGFKKLTIEHVIAAVDSRVEVPVRLEVGEMTQTVVVSAGQEALDAADATLGNVLEGSRINQLPLNARNTVGLLSLQPGVTQFGKVNGARRNVTSSQPFGSLAFPTIGQDPFNSQPPSTWGRFGGSQTPVGESRPGRVMQLGLRYAF